MFVLKRRGNMAKIEIKRAKPGDLSTIQALNSQLFELEIKNFDPQLIAEWPFTAEGGGYFADAIKNSCALIAYVDSLAIGYLVGSKLKLTYNKLNLAELDNMFVLQDYRKLGVGKKLINEFCDFAKQRWGTEGFRVTASAKNQAALNFYRKMGFEDFDITLHLKG